MYILLYTCTDRQTDRVYLHIDCRVTGTERKGESVGIFFFFLKITEKKDDDTDGQICLIVTF